MGRLIKLKETFMSNYTTKMIATMDDRSPITRSVADDLAAEFGLPVRSVISKAVLLGLYKKAEAKAKAEVKQKAQQNGGAADPDNP